MRLSAVSGSVAQARVVQCSTMQCNAVQARAEQGMSVQYRGVQCMLEHVLGCAGQGSPCRVVPSGEVKRYVL